jgi:hypothetical protein
MPSIPRRMQKRSRCHDAAIFDLGLPDGDGLACRSAVPAKHSARVLTARRGGGRGGLDAGHDYSSSRLR